MTNEFIRISLLQRALLIMSKLFGYPVMQPDVFIGIVPGVYKSAFIALGTKYDNGKSVVHLSAVMSQENAREIGNKLIELSNHMDLRGK